MLFTCRTSSLCKAIRAGFTVLAAAAWLIVAAAASGQEKAKEERTTDMGSNASTTASTLKDLNLWILVAPKNVEPVRGKAFDLRPSTGVHVVGAAMELSPGNGPVEQLRTRLEKEAGIRIRAQSGDHDIVLGVFPDGKPSGMTGVTGADLENIGNQGYAVYSEASALELAARDWAGLSNGITTLVQMAAGKTIIPAVRIRDWPSLEYRGVQQDICRGQVPTMATFKRLVDVLAQAKLNLLELYIEHTFKFRSHPDISPPEGVSPEEGRELFDYAANYHMEVHPLFQVLGHSYHILNKPQYQHLRIGPSEKMPWIMTFDIRKPEAVAFVHELVDELCQTFPGKLFNVDITEIDCDGMLEQGLTVEQLTDLVYNYVLELNKMVQPHGMRLMIAQGPLDSTGHLAGMGPKLDALPKDIIIGSYYCAGGPYKPAWEKDFPRLEEKGFDFFAQAWINSHIRLMPWVGNAADFSDAEVTCGLKHGAMGSITCDWGDAGNYHLTGQTWYPFLYHGASAWTGANVDKAYFDQAFTRLFYGLPDGSVAEAIQLAGNINGQMVKVKDENNQVVEVSTYHFWEFFGDPFTRPEIVRLADPATTGENILAPAQQAVALLETAVEKAARNRDNLEQLLFGARSYAAMGRKLVVLGHFQDQHYPRAKVADELEEVAAVYEELKAEFQRLWLAEDRENDNFHELAKRFDWTIVACKQKAAELRGA
jgi:hexosaminidase